MPKKRNHNFKKLQGPSSSGNAGASSNDTTNSPSVNERLGELRRLEGHDAARKKAELAASSNQRSVHPSLTGILGVPESAPPKAKRGLRSRTPNWTPGPAPPLSWTSARLTWTPLLALRTGRRKFKKPGFADSARPRPEQLMRFAHMTGTQSTDVEQWPSSLMHLALKTAAEQWDIKDEDDLAALVELPLRLRLRLISYLGFYGPTVDTKLLEALMQGSEAVTHLDLAGLVGYGSLTVSRLAKLAKRQPPTSEMHGADDVLESWDQDENLEAALASNPSTTLFSQLTHLSLSHPPLGISWRDMLPLSKYTPSLTHLSLAYWPRPTLTPNLATTTVSSPYGPEVAAGASHFYSVMDEDLFEPAAILRQLSSNLLQLQWLDLEGCAQWAPALAIDTSTTEPSRGTTQNNGADDAWDAVSPGVFSILVHNWKNLAYLNCSQGWTPSLSSLRLLPRSSMPMLYARIVDEFADCLHPSQLALEERREVLGPVAQRKAELWLQLEARTRIAQRKIKYLRRELSIKALTVDHGWKSSI